MTRGEPVEVVIVGSGMAGSTVAAELAAAGLDVLALEAGPERRVGDMVSSQIWSRRLRWGGAPIEGEGDLTGAITFGMGWGTGGAGLHWYGNWYRFQENDFRERTVWGHGLDWPIEYQSPSGAVPGSPGRRQNPTDSSASPRHVPICTAGRFRTSWRERRATWDR